tara:strand:+ start:294 stop:953 length:660 start_codon:yes stop_codon:yes gene_type:complete
MKNRFLVAISLLFLLTTYKTKNNNNIFFKLQIENVIIENNKIVSKEEIQKNISFIYDTNIFSITSKTIEESLKKIEFIESFKIKKIYPNELKIKIFEKKPIAILQNKQEKKYYTSSGSVINYIKLKEFEALPIVFGDEKNFNIIYNDLKIINFPIDEIKKFFLFESKRWDLVTNKNQTIKLPVNNYAQSLENFLNIKDEANLKKFKIFDYRIKNQLILK